MVRQPGLSRAEARIVACWERFFAPAMPAAARELGAYRLRDDQLRALARVRAAFAEVGGALLADPPGAGKTIVALAAAKGAPDAIVIAPAALRMQWTRSSERAAVSVRFVSFEALSREARPSIGRGGIVIVDEAHHARTPGTKRYARLAELCTGAHVLLLSATPIVNRPTDRDALLALFAGSRSAATAASRSVIRRTDVRARLPEVRRLSALVLPQGRADDAIAAMITALPPPLPAADGAAAIGLIRVSLAMAWSSSLAAMDAALRRRLQRGEALADSLRAGRWPTRAALKRWIVGDDATQLAFPTLESVGPAPPVDAMPLLAAHLDAVRALRAIVAPGVAPDMAERAQAVDAMQRRRPEDRLVVFAAHAETIRALWSSLRSTGGVVAITGERVTAAHGRWTRDEVLTAVGPRATPLRAGDPKAIRILLATDLLAEGVEMQGVSTVVHADRPWTPAAIEQREGRLVRPAPDSRRVRTESVTPRVVFVTSFSSPRGAARLLRLKQRLARKDSARQRALAHAECRTAADRAFAAWRSEPLVDAPTLADEDAEPSAFLAAIRWRARETEFIVAGLWRGSAWRITASPCVIARLALSLRAEPRRLLGVLPGIRQALARWTRRRASHALVGPAAGPGRGGQWRQLHALIDRLLRDSLLGERIARADALGRSMATLERTGGAAVARRLAALMREVAAKRLGALEFERELHALAARAPRAAEIVEMGDLKAVVPRGVRPASASRVAGPTLGAVVLLLDPPRAFSPLAAPPRQAPAACSPSASP